MADAERLSVEEIIEKRKAGTLTAQEAADWLPSQLRERLATLDVPPTPLQEDSVILVGKEGREMLRLVGVIDWVDNSKEEVTVLWQKPFGDLVAAACQAEDSTPR